MRRQWTRSDNGGHLDPITDSCSLLCFMLAMCSHHVRWILLILFPYGFFYDVYFVGVRRERDACVCLSLLSTYLHVSYSLPVYPIKGYSVRSVGSCR